MSLERDGTTTRIIAPTGPTPWYALEPRKDRLLPRDLSKAGLEAALQRAQTMRPAHGAFHIANLEAEVALRQQRLAEAAAAAVAKQNAAADILARMAEALRGAGGAASPSFSAEERAIIKEALALKK